MPRPNILVVIMDCVRAWDFPGGREATGGLPFVETLLRESVAFPRAAAVAPWTLPSHATMFTGLNPWEHGVHGKSSLFLSPQVPRLPDLLRPLGYKSAIVSANPTLCPTTGLTTGFDYATWGTMLDLFARLDHGRNPPHVYPEPPTQSVGRESIRSRVLRRLPYQEIPFRSILERNVVIPTVAGAVLERLRGCELDDAFAVARWIEPTIDKFLKSVPEQDPVFCAVNLLEAHEPYFANPGEFPDGAGWWRYSRLRQDRPGWLAHEKRRQGRDAEFLRQLYRQSVARLDRRIKGIVEAFEHAGRWDNTCLILTSDHGQAFGENGMMYHRFRVDESLIRIPLVVRFPRGQRGGETARGWASQLDIAPTCFRVSGSEPPANLTGVPLFDLIDADRPTPVVAITDGSIGEQWIPESRRPELDRLGAAAYQDGWKVTYTAEPDEYHAYDVDRDYRESSDCWTAQGESLKELASRARDAVGKILSGPQGSISAEVSDRLKAWGYI
jgi:arylsulfatase A-like enzyme